MTSAWVTAEDLEDPTLADAEEAARAASSIMWALSGRKFTGTVVVTEEYSCSGRAICSASAYRRYAPACSVHQQNRVTLRGKPVRSVYEVVEAPGRANARIIPASEYQIINRAYLRPAYGASWRPCSTLQITYEYGAEIPEFGKRAARVLANELVKARLDPDSCALPDRVTSVSRQGISMTILDPQDFLDGGRTGLYEVDLFLKAVNPDKARKRARVFSPDLKPPARITAGTPGAHDLVISPGYSFSKTFMWETNGDPTAITGNWDISALIKNSSGTTLFDLEPYMDVEPGGEEGRIDLIIPAPTTTTFTAAGTWTLIMTNIADPGIVIKLLSGSVAIAPA